MAPGAICAEAAVVNIVARVAGCAFAAGLCRFLARRVAGGADEAAMFPGQRELRHAVVIERPLLPIHAVMAGGAIGVCAQSARMMVILVTGGAGCTLRGKCLVRMATYAR